MKAYVLVIAFWAIVIMAMCQWTADYTFSVNPTQITNSFYDYMIGSYNNISVMQRPSDGKYLMVYHGKPGVAGERQCYYSVVDPATGTAISHTLTNVNSGAGYPAMAIDPVTEMTFFAWHANTDSDSQYEVKLCWERTPSDSGVLSIPQTVFDASVYGEFIWPSITIGASPIEGKRRIYVLGRNNLSNHMYPMGTARIAFADYDGRIFEASDSLVWTYVSIPTLEQWDNENYSRKPYLAITAGGHGNIYVMGWHSAGYGYNELPEDKVDVFSNSNYGAGEWIYSHAPDEFYCPINQQGNPANHLLWFGIANSSHFNLGKDNLGRFHIPAIMGIQAPDGYSYPSMQYARDYVYEPVDSLFELKEVYPIAGTASDNVWFLPWDSNGDGIVNPDNELFTYFPFAHWDQTLHNNEMMYYYNQIRMTNANTQGMMACVWQASRQLSTAPEDPPVYANNISISVSPDNGNNWSEPIELDSTMVAFNGIIPMWVYPAGEIEYIGMNADSRKVGKLGLMFYDDYDWDASVLSPPAGPTTGGRVMFTELEITFPNFGVGVDDESNPSHAITSINTFPNPFISNLKISLSLAEKGSNNLSIYNLKGQKVKTLTDAMLDKGQHSFVWNGFDTQEKQVASGVYYIKLQNSSGTALKKVLYLR